MTSVGRASAAVPKRTAAFVWYVRVPGGRVSEFAAWFRRVAETALLRTGPDESVCTFVRWSVADILAGEPVSRRRRVDTGVASMYRSEPADGCAEFGSRSFGYATCNSAGRKRTGAPVVGVRNAAGTVQGTAVRRPSVPTPSPLARNVRRISDLSTFKGDGAAWYPLFAARRQWGVANRFCDD